MPAVVTPSGIHAGDCVELMAALPAGCAQLAVADPPYNIGYAYEGYADDQRALVDYLAWSETWIRGVHRALDDTGSFWLVVGPAVVSEVDLIAKGVGFHQRAHNLWVFGFGVAEVANFATCHTHLLYYVKDPKRFHFDREAVRVPSARQLIYNDKRADARGRLPTDVWVHLLADLDGLTPGASVEHEPRIAGTFGRRCAVPNQIPEPIVARMIRTTSRPADLVIDPFCGSGTTAAVARKLGRAYWTCDLPEAESTLATARARVTEAEPGQEVA
jgi:site-specific DNA-methyltransferase (adenine-specific)